jgi:hypothetical protein
VYTHQREGGFIVDFRDVFYDPRLSCVATCAIIPDGLIVHIRVTAYTRRTCFLKVEIRMTGLAFDVFMLALEPKTCCFMTEFSFGIERPTARTVALGTIHTESFPMRVLREQCRGN